MKREIRFHILKTNDIQYRISTKKKLSIFRNYIIVGAALGVIIREKEYEQKAPPGASAFSRDQKLREGDVLFSAGLPYNLCRVKITKIIYR
jgi:hypothetical protein